MKHREHTGADADAVPQGLWDAVRPAAADTAEEEEAEAADEDVQMDDV